MALVKRKAYEQPEIMVVDVQCDNMLLAASDEKTTTTIQFDGGGDKPSLGMGVGDPDDID